jgi:3D (Asp-Asp-Asp) domain-containing protein
MKIMKQEWIGFLCVYAVIAGIFFIILGLSHKADTDENMVLQQQKGVFTAYTACIDETDSDPMVTASNKKVRRGIIANNCLPFGTRIKVNGKIYEVQDRMNERYGCDKFDIYMCDHPDAVEFGKKVLSYEII